MVNKILVLFTYASSEDIGEAAGQCLHCSHTERGQIGYGSDPGFFFCNFGKGP